jgi:hypothetical protein
MSSGISNLIEYCGPNKQRLFTYECYLSDETRSKLAKDLKSLKTNSTIFTVLSTIGGYTVLLVNYLAF